MTLYRRIFLADDDDDDRMIFTEALSEIDSSIFCYHAVNGELALQALTGDFFEKPEIIFLDINMPKLNGMDVLRQIRRTSTFAAIPVIMYSTFFSTSDIEELTKLGASHYLFKHANFAELCKSVKMILGRMW